MDTQIPQAVTDARSNAARLGATAADYAGSEYTVPDQLRKTIQEAYNYNKDIIGMRSTALADYLASPAQAQARFAPAQAGQPDNFYGIFDPFERNAAIQNYIREKEVPFSFANTLLGMREGTIADTVRAATGAFQAQSTAAQAAAQAARQTYADVLNEFQVQAQLEQDQQKIAQEQQRIDMSKKSAGGSDFNSIFASLAQLKGNNGQGGEVMGPPGPDPLDVFQKEVPEDITRNLLGGQSPSIFDQLGITKGNFAQQKPDFLSGINIKKGILPQLDLGGSMGGGSAALR